MKHFAKQHKHHLWVWVLLVIVAVISGYLAFPSDEGGPTNEQPIEIEQQTLEETADNEQPAVDQEAIKKQSTDTSAEKTTKEIINSKDEIKTSLIVGGTKYYVSLPENSTVYDLMQKLAEKNDFSFSGKDYAGMGFFVEEINGIKNDSKENKFWIYYVNNESAKVGISNYIIKQDDLIEWNYETPTDF